MCNIPPSFTALLLSTLLLSCGDGTTSMRSSPSYSPISVSEPETTSNSPEPQSEPATAPREYTLWRSETIVHSWPSIHGELSANPEDHQASEIVTQPPHIFPSTAKPSALPSACSEAHNQHISPLDQRKALTSWSTLLFATRARNTDSYHIYAYLKGQWTGVAIGNLVSRGQHQGSHIELRSADSIITAKLYEHNPTAPHHMRLRAAIPIAHEYSLSTYLAALEPSKGKNEVLQALRRRSWYGPAFGLTHLQDIHIVLDLAPYSVCVARYSKPLAKAHYNNPALVFPSSIDLRSPELQQPPSEDHAQEDPLKDAGSTHSQQSSDSPAPTTQ